jgi:hypothetical protein
MPDRKPPVSCPHCGEALLPALADTEVRRLWASRNGAKQAKHAGPGRPKGSRNSKPHERKEAK